MVPKAVALNVPASRHQYQVNVRFRLGKCLLDRKNWTLHSIPIMKQDCGPAFGDELKDTHWLETRKCLETGGGAQGKMRFGMGDGATLEKISKLQRARPEDLSPSFLSS